jgi:hypothetical protein
MKTESIKRLMDDVLSSLPRPYTEHVIEDVFCAIELTTKWHKRYDDLCEEFGKTVTNTLGGYWIGRALGKVGKRQITSRRSKLLGSYSILDADAPPPPARKPKQSEAAQLMSDYYQANKDKLPASIRKHRELIIELLMDGLSLEQAFAMALDSGA